MPCECGREVDLRLLVLGPVVRHLLGVAELLEGLTEAGDVAVAEDSPNAGDESLLPAVAFDELLGHEADDGLARGQSNRPHRTSPCATDCKDDIIGPHLASRFVEGGT